MGGSDRSVKTDKEAIAAVAAVVGEEEHSEENVRWGSTSSEHRKLEAYHVNLMAMGGAIGTGLFIYIGSGLTGDGPANLLIGYTLWTSVTYAISMVQMELVAFWPTDAAFSRNAARYIDESFGFALSYIFWVGGISNVIFEVTAFCSVLGYWADTLNYNVSIYLALLLASYFAINIWSAKFFGNAEFVCAIGKMLLVTGLLLMTFITMLGGNPIHDRYGFRFWQNPGAFKSPYPEENASHATKIFQGTLDAVTNAAFVFAGPEYLTAVAGEARNPRKTMPAAFRKTIYRLVLFFIGSALAVGIVCASNDEGLLNAQATGSVGAANSPYVLAMIRMKIKVLPAIVNVLILSSIYSAGNAYYFTNSRVMAQIARDGHAPRFLSKRNRNGVPYYAIILTASITLLAFCQASSSAIVVINWMVGLVTCVALISWFCFAWTWIRWNAAMKAQGVSRASLPATAYGTAFLAWYALIFIGFIILAQGYTVFLSGGWNTQSFIYSYVLLGVFVVLSVGFKLYKRFTVGHVNWLWIAPKDVDLVTHISDSCFGEYSYSYEDEERSAVGRAVHTTLNRVF
ncbi:hypothetical protein MNV49_005518 [Pseudohyphozyma bogoriensis]|nr:hypothetical protein MNV49_005518 [Pseudohyphozyma bogoriensis]